MTRQYGYALLTMMVVLFAGGAWWMTLTSVLQGRPSVGSRMRRSPDLQAIANARQSMLSYSTSYAALYGPSSAGPGHLPCPDTDTIGTDLESVLFAGDGPNPPCSGAHHTSGMLPRHVSLPNHRFAFHYDPVQRFGYSVSTRFVNNPATWPVNPGVLQMDAFSLPAVALIRSSPLSLQDNSILPSQFRISRTALLQSLQPAVAAWVLDTAVPLLKERCSDVEKCTTFLEYYKRCENVDEQSFLLWLVDELPSLKRCPSDATEGLLIDNIPASSHWFIRNRWPEWVSVKVLPGCENGSLDSCSLVYRPVHTDSPSTDRNSLGTGRQGHLLFEWMLGS